MSAPPRVVVAGASRGIGLALCAVYAADGAEVVAICRRSTPELEALGVEIVDGVDFGDDAAVAGLAAAVPGPIDALIYNAGINEDSHGLEDIDTAALARMFDVNALGAVRVVLALAPALRNPAKIMVLGTGSPALNVNAFSVGNYGYRMSKAAMGSFAFGVARDLRDRGVAVLVGGPGPVDTDMLRETAVAGRTTFDPADAPSAAEVAAMLRDRLAELTLEDSPAWHEGPSGKPVSF
jgi:NAD(P)-dependent dehydrogenase (short-subunit alcohol dehydrogenase family)